MSYAPPRWGCRMRPVGGAKQLERRRERAIALLKDGRAPVEVARLVGVDRRSVRRWNAVYRKAGVAGLAARPVPGRPSKLTARQREQLETLLVRGAGALAYRPSPPEGLGDRRPLRQPRTPCRPALLSVAR